MFFYKAKFVIADNNEEYIDDYMYNSSLFSRNMLQISR